MEIKVIDSPAAMQEHALQRQLPCAMVPTMGALHRGHLELIRVARTQVKSGGEVTVSIYVNPLQFEPGADFEKYPRPEAADESACRDAGVDVLFRPREIYFPDRSVFVEENVLANSLCGASRPGHFRGVCTVVAKLFHLVAPQSAIFGEKDYQQLAVIRRMVRDLNFAIKVIGVPTVREADGLALSSRNQYLNTIERSEATVLRRAALEMKAAVADGEKSVSKLLLGAREMIQSRPNARIDYLSIVDGQTLQPLDSMREDSVLALAVWIGRTRLIDNLRLA
ncbi:MAG: pantoate--beta-alanine ligase [Verrucomicrobiota bacterium]